MDVAGFKAFFPEFAQTDTIIVQGALSEASRMIATEAWGPFGTTSGALTKADDGQKWLAGHILATTPFGQATRLKPGDGDTIYWKRYAELRDSLGYSFIVSGVLW